MKTSVNYYDFAKAFEDYGRGKQFPTGLSALFDYLEELENDLGEEFELDVIGLCCEYTEYDNIEEFQRDYGADDYPDMDSIMDVTTVIPIDGSDAFIVADF